MSEPITFTGHVPGVLRRCSPIVWRQPVPTGIHGKMGWRRGVWFPMNHKADEGMVCWDQWCGPERVESFVYAGNVGLDLTDATGRAHLAVFIETKVEYLRGDLMGVSPAVGRKGWSGSPAWGIVVVTRQDGAMSILFDSDDIPALADLDPDDPRTLPDGSRIVDALALRAVGLHVAGISDNAKEIR